MTAHLFFIVISVVACEQISDHFGDYLSPAEEQKEKGGVVGVEASRV